MNLKSLDQIKQDLLSKLQSSTTDAELESFRLEYLSRQGLIAQYFEQLKTMDAQQKREVGPHLNSLKQEIQAAFDIQKEKLFALILEKENQKKQTQ